CGIILRRMGGPLGYTERMTVCDGDDQTDLVMQIARMRGIEPTKPQARMLAMVANDWRENLGADDDLAALAGDKLDDAELGVVRKYFDVLRARNQTDFSGLLSETVRMLRTVDDARERLRKRFRFIQVDEYQDTNRAQNEIVELIANDEDNVLAVGDMDQSIYEWRGASPDAMPRFIELGKQKTGNCVVVKLGTNYRSTPEIIAVADTLIRHTSNRIEVEFSTVNKSGDPPRLAAFETPELEADAIAGGIENLVRKEYVPAQQIAIFYRTNDMSRPIEQALAKRQVPYLVIGSGSYYDRMEVKDVLSMLRFVCNPRDGISFHRIANKPARGMGDTLIGKLEWYAEHHGVDLLTAMLRADALQDDNGRPLSEGQVKACHDCLSIFYFDLAGKSVHDVVNELLDRTQYDKWLKEKYEEKGEYEARSRNVNELANSIAEFARANRGATIADYLQSISLYTDSDKAKDSNAVRLMSLHASKGLEFDVVYMVGVEHGILPHEKAVKDRGDRGLEEERRLCYVGFTRARKVLRVTWCRKRQDVFSRSRDGRMKPTLPSRFLMEAGLMSKVEFDAARVDGMKSVRVAKAAQAPGKTATEPA
ncbi:MAG TPA: 3'-5' exonuclease, partial [Tepidisphaeraceae bacterium]|nr:3'-5' exonuclease [Tepidisphaeraceae bacterium]